MFELCSGVYAGDLDLFRMPGTNFYNRFCAHEALGTGFGRLAMELTSDLHDSLLFTRQFLAPTP